MADLLTLMCKTQEAQAVRLGVKVARQFTDAELAGSMELLAEAEAELYGPGPIPFRVTVTFFPPRQNMKQAIEEAMQNRPARCPHCGASFQRHELHAVCDTIECADCGTWFVARTHADLPYAAQQAGEAKGAAHA